MYKQNKDRINTTIIGNSVHFNTLFVNNKYGKCIAVLALFLFCSTCCCFGCFCCCCCFNFCCRRCAPQPQFDPDTNNNTNNEYHDNEVL